MKHLNSSFKGFTLIELLIVVAIIGILAAIAIPNFLNAQVRAKVSRCKSDMRMVGTCLEMYRVDNNEYPPRAPASIPGNKNRGGIHTTIDLTTPVAYCSSVLLRDPFSTGKSYDEHGAIIGGEASRHYSYAYVNIEMYRKSSGMDKITYPLWIMISLGPDFLKGPGPSGEEWFYGWYGNDPITQNYYPDLLYDPTNGTISNGDILRWQGKGE